MKGSASVTKPPARIDKNPKPEQTDVERPEVAEILEAEVDRLIGNQLPQKARSEIVSRLTAVVYSEQFSGPIAHPRHLREYEQIAPGAADRIISMAEKRNDHHINMDKNILDAEARDQKLGMILGAGLFALLIFSALAIGLLTRDPIMAGIFLAAGAIGGVGLFIRGRNGKS